MFIILAPKEPCIFSQCLLYEEGDVLCLSLGSTISPLRFFYWPFCPCTRKVGVLILRRIPPQFLV